MIEKIAEFLTQELYIPPGGTVPASPKKRIAEWVEVLKKVVE